MSSRRVRKEFMSKSWSDPMFVVSETPEQSAVVMPLAMVTIALQMGRMTSTSKVAVVIIGRTAVKMARLEVVACCHGGVAFVVIGKEYLSTIGFPSAMREEDTALLIYI